MNVAASLGMITVNARIVLAALLLAALPACRRYEFDEAGGCGGATCPFAVGGYGQIEGTVLRADGSPYAASARQGVNVSCGSFASYEWPVDVTGRYQVKLQLYDPFKPKTLRCEVTAGYPVIARDSATVQFSPSLSEVVVTRVDLRERP